MKRVTRDLQVNLINSLKPGSIVSVEGASGVGKTQLLKQIHRRYGTTSLYLNADKEKERLSIQDGKALNMSDIPSLCIIDQAHLLNNWHQVVEAILKHHHRTRIIISVESIAQLKNNHIISHQHVLFPLREGEFKQFKPVKNHEDFLAQRLVYGNYPRLLHLKTRREQQNYLKELVHLYIRTYFRGNEQKGIKLFRMLSFLVGREIFYRELEQKVSLSRRWIEQFIEVLIERGIIYRLWGIKRKLKKEVGKHACLYFTDNGVRNAIIDDFNPVRIRSDVDKLWKNYLISERIKQQGYRNMATTNFFWRTYDQQDLDWVEEYQGQLTAYRFSLESDAPTAPSAWRRAYPKAEYKVIHPDNYQEWLGYWPHPA